MTSSDHPKYFLAKGNSAIDNLKENTQTLFSQVFASLSDFLQPKYLEFILNNSDGLDAAVNHEVNYAFDISSVNTFVGKDKGYLLRDSTGTKVLELPSHLFMRVAVQLFYPDIKKVLHMYKLLSTGLLSAPSPILFNSCKVKNNLVSCFLIHMADNGQHINHVVMPLLADISSLCGGLGVGESCLRVGLLKGGGYASGPMKYTKQIGVSNDNNDQGGSRAANAAIYMSFWHASIREHMAIRLGKSKTAKTAISNTIHPAVWMQDIMMVRLLKGEDISLFCPNDAKGLAECHGVVFEQLYVSYEKNLSIKRETVPARQMFLELTRNQVMTGEPYMMFDDTVNTCSNQQNIGRIRQSNLCCEIMEVTSDTEFASCNLMGISPSAYVKDKRMDWTLFKQAVHMAVEACDNAIDASYAISEEYLSKPNKKYRPIAVGIIGIANCMAKMDIVYDSDAGYTFLETVSAGIYFYALEASVELAKLRGSYVGYEGSPFSMGKLQFDLKEQRRLDMVELLRRHGLHDRYSHLVSEQIVPIDPETFGCKKQWNDLKMDIMTHGIRNSLITSNFPTATTSALQGLNESFEPYSSNLFTRKLGTGDYVVYNKELVADMEHIGLWNKRTVQYLRDNKGSIQGIHTVFDMMGKEIQLKHIEAKYKTVFEISQKSLFKAYSKMNLYIDQSSSNNVHMKSVSVSDVINNSVQTVHLEKLLCLHVDNWFNGLKTSNYYVRTQPVTEAISHCNSCSV